MFDLLINILGTIIGGLFLTLILFLLNEFVYPKTNLTGEWTATIKYERTSYRPFENLTLVYKIHIIQKGYELSGSGEKISDIYPDGTKTDFSRDKRVLMEVKGYFERTYLARSKVYLNINEKGHIRETRATYFLTFIDHTNLHGTFISTAADTIGTIKMLKS